VLEKNHHLTQGTLDDLSKGKAAEHTQCQESLHRNPVYLATIWDSNQNMQSPEPATPGASPWPWMVGARQGAAVHRAPQGAPVGLLPGYLRKENCSRQQFPTVKTHVKNAPF
uniref:SS18 N-terminal domain-containing protein n=1 Tax=Capra hircus TaxID=9925 RepID=A0A8C2SBG1_CAPHI